MSSSLLIFYYGMSNLPINPIQCTLHLKHCILHLKKFNYSLFISSMSLNVLKYRTVIITVLMSLSANSNICVNSRSVVIIFYLIIGPIFLFLCIPDIVNFTLLGARYFCISMFLSFVLELYFLKKQFDPFVPCF